MSEIVRRAGLSALEVLREHLWARRPVIITDEVPRWPASRWTFASLRERCGDVRVTTEIGLGEGNAPRFEMPLRDYIDRLLAREPGPPMYLRHWEFWRDSPELAAEQRLPAYLRDWLVLLPESIWPRMNWIFIGPEGSRTSLHLDSLGTHSWLAQIVGRKRWRLYPPEQVELLYPRADRRGGLGTLFQIDPDAEGGVDPRRFPRFAEATAIECETGPGDLCVIPAGWAHSVQNLEATVALTGNLIGPGADARTWLREGLGYYAGSLRERISRHGSDASSARRP